MSNVLLKNQKPSTRLLLFVVMILVLMIVGGLLTTGFMAFYYDMPLESIDVFLADYSRPQTINALGIINAGTQVFGFLLASLVFMKIFGHKSVNGFWVQYIGVSLLLAPVIMILANPLIGLTMEINNFLIPEGSWLESVFKPMEDRAAEATQALLRMPDLGSLFKNILLIAAIPAVSEEFVFRGVLQSQFTKWTKNVHWGIWISAFLFSAIHMQFYGFIPRMLMGALLGYLLIWTGSIWAPILAHFTNNLVAVLASYYVQHTPGLTDELLEEKTNTLPTLLIGILFFSAVLWYVWKRSRWQEIRADYLFEEPSIWDDPSVS